MVFIVIVLLILLVIFVSLFFLECKEIKLITNKLKQINTNDTKQIITMNLPTKNNQELVSEINKILLNKQEIEIQHCNKEKRIKTTITNVSHDMKTPLTAILGYINLINSNQISDEDKERYLKIIEKRAVSLQKLLIDYFDYSYINEADYCLALEKIDVNEYCREIIAELYDSYEKDKVRFEVNLLEVSPKVMANKISVRRIIENIFQNAKKYGKDKIKVTSYLEENKLIISISNQSDMITKKDVDKLFDRNHTTDIKNSTGLGLSISKTLLEKMGHQIEASYKKNTFTIKMIYKLVEEENGRGK